MQRVHYRRKNHFNTKSNVVRVVKTPGGKLVYQSVTKKASPVVCGISGKRLIGIKRVRPSEMSRLKKRERTVARAYGGCMTGKVVRERILRAFLVEEQRLIKAVAAEEARKAAAEKKAGDKKKGKKSNKGKK